MGERHGRRIRRPQSSALQSRSYCGRRPRECASSCGLCSLEHERRGACSTSIFFFAKFLQPPRQKEKKVPHTSRTPSNQNQSSQHSRRVKDSCAPRRLRRHRRRPVGPVLPSAHGGTTSRNHPERDVTTLLGVEGVQPYGNPPPGRALSKFPDFNMCETCLRPLMVFLFQYKPDTTLLFFFVRQH